MPNTMLTPVIPVTTEDLRSIDDMLVQHWKLLSSKEIKGLFAGTALNSNDYMRCCLLAINNCAMVSVFDAKGHVVYVNDNYCRRSGYERKELIGTQHAMLDYGLSVRDAIQKIDKVRQTGHTWHGEVCAHKKSGLPYWVETNVVTIEDNDGAVLFYYALSFDITKRHAAEQRHYKFEQVMRRMLSMTKDWYWEQDRELKYTIISRGISEMDREMLPYLGRTRWEGALPQDREAWRAHRAVLTAQKPFADFEYRVIDPRDPNRLLWITCSGEPIHDEMGNFYGYRGIARNITKAHIAQDNIWKATNEDPLTKLPNRYRFNTALEQAVQNARLENMGFALVVLDLDHFEAINDGHGHPVGDAILKVIAARLKKLVPSADCLGRLDGDEFAVLMPGVGEQADTLLLLEDIRQLTQLGDDNKHLPKVTLSIGVAVFPNDAADASELLKNAQIALHKAKASGRNQHFLYRSEHRARIERRAVLLDQVQTALQADHLLLYYQPIVQLDDPSRVSFEALLRWNHPDKGVVSASAFGDAFDNLELAGQLGKFVAQQAIAQARKWRSAGVPFHQIAINVTSADFAGGRYPQWIHTQLLQHGVSASDICVEVTESMVLGHSSEMTIQGLGALKAMGVQISFDDFGTGYASLSHLRLPIDRLKIDGSFVAEIDTDKTNAAIVAAMVQLGLSLGKDITIEGVETQLQAKILQAMGCNLMQGYLYSRALPADQVEAFLSHHLQSRGEIPALPWTPADTTATPERPAP